jgi:hypothetical protein
LLIVEHLLFQVVDMVFIAFGGHARAHLSIGDGLE